MIISKDYGVAAFSGESQTNRYLVFAAQAEKEGFFQIAQLFRATAQGGGHWESLAEENNELREISALMLAPATGRNKHPGSPKGADGKKKTRTAPYLKALERLAHLPKGEYCVCSECGYTCDQNCPEECPLCRSKAIIPVQVG